MRLPWYLRAPCFVEFYTQLNFMLIKFFNEFLLLAGQVGFASTLDGLLWSNPSDSSLAGLAKSFLQLTVGCSLVRDFSAYSNKWAHRKCTHTHTHPHALTLLLWHRLNHTCKRPELKTYAPSVLKIKPLTARSKIAVIDKLLFNWWIPNLTTRFKIIPAKYLCVKITCGLL